MSDEQLDAFIEKIRHDEDFKHHLIFSAQSPEELADIARSYGYHVDPKLIADRLFTPEMESAGCNAGPIRALLGETNVSRDYT